MRKANYSNYSKTRIRDYFKANKPSEKSHSTTEVKTIDCTPGSESVRRVSKIFERMREQF